jgi:hypothetical protein
VVDCDVRTLATVRTRYQPSALGTVDAGAFKTSRSGQRVAVAARGKPLATRLPLTGGELKIVIARGWTGFPRPAALTGFARRRTDLALNRTVGTVEHRSRRRRPTGIRSTDWRRIAGAAVATIGIFNKAILAIQQTRNRRTNGRRVAGAKFTPVLVHLVAKLAKDVARGAIADGGSAATAGSDKAARCNRTTRCVATTARAGAIQAPGTSVASTSAIRIEAVGVATRNQRQQGEGRSQPREDGSFHTPIHQQSPFHSPKRPSSIAKSTTCTRDRLRNLSIPGVVAIKVH